MRDKENILEIIKTVFEYERKNAEANIPDQGPFESIICAFNFKGGNHEAFVSVKRSSRDRNVCLLILSMHRRLSDRIFSCFASEGSREDIIAWLEDGKNIEAAYGEFELLADKMDDYYACH